jgi:hypothetical protein
MPGQYTAVVRNALSAAQADAQYLRLDCANDPLTDELDGVAFDTYSDVELVTNGTFDTADDWDFGGDWTYDGGNQRADMTGVIGLNGNLSPSAGSEVAIQVGRQYLLQYEVVAMSLAEVTPSCGGQTGPTETSAGTKTWIFTATSTADLNFYGELTAGVGKHYIRLDNVTLKQVGWLRGFGYLVGGAECSGDLYPVGPGGMNLGQDANGIFQIWLHDGLSSGPNLAASGLVARFTGGDMAVGVDNIYPGYYVQKTVVHNSTATDSSDDYTNLYQGDVGYPRIALMYDIEHQASPLNGCVIGDATTEPPAMYWGAITDQGFYLRLNKTDQKMVMRSSAWALYLEIGLAGTDPAVRPDTDDLIDLGDSANSLRWRNLYLTGLAQIGGALDHDGSTVGFYGTAPVSQPAALTTALTQISHTGPTTPDYAIAAPVDSGVGSAWGFSTQDEFETAMSVILNLQTRVDELEGKLQSLGLLA